MDGAMKSNALLLAALVLAIVGLFYVNLLIEQGAPGRDTAPILAATTPSVPKQTPQAAALPMQASGALSKTFELIHAADDYAKAAPDKKQAALSSMASAAEERKELLLALMEENPTEAIKAISPPGFREQNPQIAQYVEQEVELSGELDVWGIDYVDEQIQMFSHSKTEHFLKVDGATYKLHFEGYRRPESGGALITVRGFLLGNDVLVPTGNARVEYPAQPGSPGSPLTEYRPKKVAVLLYNWQNNPIEPWTVDNVKDAVFRFPNSSAAYYNEASFSQQPLEGIVDITGGDVFGWYTLPYDNTSCNFNTWVNAVRAAAIAEGVNLSAYNNVIHVSAGASCGYPGGAQQPGTRVYIDGQYIFWPDVISHELGHNYDLHHANTYTCYEHGTAVTLSHNCTSNEYGDEFDIMGISSPSLPDFHFNNYHKGRLNWWLPQNTLTVNASGIYEIEPQEWAGNGTKVLRIWRGQGLELPDWWEDSGVYYYLEARQSYGFFDNFTYYSLGNDFRAPANGVSIRLAPEYTGLGRRTQLLDMTPGTSGGSYKDEPLPVGWSYADPEIGLTIQVLNVSPSGATVNLTFDEPECVLHSPAVSLTPSMQWGSPGAQRTYVLNVTNNDNVICPFRTFNLMPALPAGWGIFPALQPLTLGPRESMAISRNVGSPYPYNNPLEGSYEFSIRAEDSQNASYFGAASATYNLLYNLSMCGRANPTVSISPESQLGRPGEARNYTVSVTNNDNTGCEPSAFNVTPMLPAGWSHTVPVLSLAAATAPPAALAAPAIRLAEAPGDPAEEDVLPIQWPPRDEQATAESFIIIVPPGQTGTSAITVASPSNAPEGPYQFSETAVNMANASYSGAATATYEVAHCIRSNPEVSILPPYNFGEPGDARNYTVIVASNDNSLCGSSTFGITPTLPAGWSQSPSSPTISVAPGSTGTAAISVTSDANSQPGEYQFYERATNLQNESFFGEGAAAYMAGTCIQANHTVIISPPSQSGLPGQSRYYELNITNNDHDSCPYNQFRYYITKPPGSWSSNIVGNVSMYVYPGETGNRTFYVGPSASVTPGSYSFNITARKPTTPYTVTATAIFNVIGEPCARANPSVSITPQSQSGSPGDARTYTLSVTNNDNSVCGSSNFGIASTLPAGWSQSPSSPTISVAPDSTQTVAISVTSDADATPGSYQFTERAVNMQNASFNASAQATYLVLLPDFTPPVVTISSPQNNSILQGNNVQISSSASDASGILLMQIWANGQLRATCSNQGTCSTNWNVHSLAPGTYPITVGATDNSPNQNYANATIFVIKQ